MRGADSSVRLATLLAAFSVAGCNLPFTVPGLSPILGAPPEPLVPEPLSCGHSDDPAPVTTDPKAAIKGAADFHNHQFANLGFGGRVLWGSAFHPQGIEPALSACGADALCVDDREAAFCDRVVCAFAPNPTQCREKCQSARCPTSPPHGHLGVTDPIGMALGQGTGHAVGGYPHFVGWPHYNTYTHQQVYHRWLRRAFDGGLKLMVMLAVTNEVLCKFLGHAHACDDMTNVDKQLAAAQELERFIDQQNDCEVNGNGWYRIARSPAEARKIIADGAMAVVLGIEVDTLFNCSQYGSCTEKSVRDAIAKYRALGVRHVFPVHVFDNAFGGAAAYHDLFNFGNAVVNRDLLHVDDCSGAGYTFQFGKAGSKVNGLIASMAAELGIRYDDYPDHGAHCNQRSLTPLGKQAVRAMMNADLVIDVDHMSAKTRDGVLDLAQSCGYPGVVSGHSGFTALYRGDKRSEGQLTEDELKRIAKLGGLIAPILHQGSRAELTTHGSIPHDCGNSAKSFAQAYLYAVDKMKEHAPNAGALLAVGFGSDANGLAGLPAPRFGQYACGGDGVAQAGKVEYPLTPLHGVVASLPRAQAGYRVFDINYDGYAHAGMFPDFVAELEAIGVGRPELEPLFNSAEAYVRMWEAIEKQPACP